MLLNTAERTLVIAHQWPDPKASAAGTHLSSLLNLLAEQSEQLLLVSTAVVPEHLNLPYDHQQIAVNDSHFDDFLREFSPTLVVFDRFMTEEQFGWRVKTHCPDALRILNTEDLHCLRKARQQILGKHSSLMDNLLTAPETLRELAAILRCDLSLLLSEFEIALLVAQFKVDPALLVYNPFMLEAEDFLRQVPGFSERQHFVSIGNFLHAPNWDAVLQLKQLWPQIKAQLPHAECHIYGAYMPEKAKQLHNPKQGFLLLGKAENAREVLQSARVLLAPLRFGAGIKGKLLDAMLAGTPSVTSAIGCEAMSDNKSWPGLIANNPRAQIDAALALYTQKDLWQRCQIRGLELARSRYSALPHQNHLVARISQVQENLASHRQSNWLGQLLQRRQYQSTEYMARWIEAKNRLAALQAAPASSPTDGSPS